MMHSLVDVAGTNGSLNQVLANAVGAIGGMVTPRARYAVQTRKQQQQQQNKQLVEDGFVDAVADATTTEMADEVAGGVFPGGPTKR
ncbi:hypothetical protein KEM54_000205 [Ascosphaera aggregata]|nr:hypothetical protein KEM54_000205 [Ascosphaera aggregata]